MNMKTWISRSPKKTPEYKKMSFPQPQNDRQEAGGKRPPGAKSELAEKPCVHVTTWTSLGTETVATVVKPRGEKNGHKDMEN